MAAPPSRSDAPAGPDALLRESAWLRRLAGGLLRDAAAADDLAQDVLVAALHRRPALEGARLRGWLASAARRIAWRRRARDAARDRVEAERARSAGAVDRDALAHLGLHRRLAEAILALEPPYRTAIVLRYLEDLSTREIAARLGIAEAAARKRVSRGLARLREALDADEGRGAWIAAAAALLRGSSGGVGPAPHDPPAPTPPDVHTTSAPTDARAPGPGACSARPAPEGPAPPRAAGRPAARLPQPFVPLLAAVMGSKLVVLALAVAAVSAVLLAVRGGLAPARGEAPALAAAPPADGVLAGSDAAEADDAALAATERPLERSPVLAGTTATPAAAVAGPRLRVLARDGAPLVAPAAAWVDAARRVRVIALGGDASAPLPAEARDAVAVRFFAGARGCAPAWSDGLPESGDLVLALERSVAVRGRVIEDGGPPLRPLDLGIYTRDDGIVADSHTGGVRRKLAAAGIVRGYERVWTAPDGAFELEGFRRGEEVSVGLPTTHRYEPSTSAAGRIRAGEDVELRLTRLPSVRGRLVWDDDGSPVRGGGLIVTYEDARGFGGPLTALEFADDGRFEIGLPVRDGDLELAPSERRTIYAKLRFDLNRGGTRAPVGFEREVALDPETLPLDLGELRVEPARELAVRIVDRTGRPVAGAAVASGVASATTNADGLAHVGVAPGDALSVLAPRFALREVSVPAEPSAEPLEVRLEPGTALLVRTGAAERGLKVRLRWERTPFEGAAPEHPLPRRVHTQLLGSPVLAWGNRRVQGQPGYVDLPLPPEGPLVVAGLRPGSELTVALLDACDEPFEEHPVVLPDGPGESTVELALEEPMALRVRILDPAGGVPPGASILLRRSVGRRGSTFAALGDLVTAYPLSEGAYDVTARATGFLPRTVQGHALRAGALPLEVRLDPARLLALRVVDGTGHALGARRISARAASGWSASPDWNDAGAFFPVTAPTVPLEVEATVGTRSYRAAVDGDATEAVVRVPAHARVRFELDRVPALQGEYGDVVLHLREVEGNGSLRTSIAFQGGVPGPLAEEVDLLPGAYALVVDLEEWIDATEETRTRRLAERRIEVAGDTVVRVEVGG
jgi:RNA polymerase sigma-70 factor (ECF subfamily)